LVIGDANADRCIDIESTSGLANGDGRRRIISCGPNEVADAAADAAATEAAFGVTIDPFVGIGRRTGDLNDSADADDGSPYNAFCRSDIPLTGRPTDGYATLM
jgi:hypothetical protein